MRVASRDESDGRYETDEEAGEDAFQLPPCPAELEGMGGMGCAGCGCCCIVTILLMLLTSFQGLHATKFALRRNKVSGTVDFGAVYHGGRNLIGFWNTYIEFPATIQAIEWVDSSMVMTYGRRDLSPMQMRTADGLMVGLGVVAEYHVVKEKVPDIYQHYLADYETFFINNLRSAFQVLIGGYRATELYTERLKVSKGMYETCQKVCQENLKGYLTCWGVQLNSLTLAPKIEEANVRQQVEMQNQHTELMKRQASLTRSETRVKEAEYERLIKVVQANATAEAYKIKHKAQSDADSRWQEARAGALGIVSNSVKMMGQTMTPAQLLTYLERMALIDSPNSPMLYGDFQSASVFFQANKPSDGGMSQAEL